MKFKTLLLIAVLNICAAFNIYAQVNIIPQPQSVVINDNQFTIKAGTSIVSTFESKETALLLKEYLFEEFAVNTLLTDSKRRKDKSIQFVTNKEIGKEGYEVNVSNNGIRLVASTTTGWFYALQSLKQLLPVPGEKRTQEDLSISGLSIKDEPRFSWRAFMLDEARHFKGMDQVKLLLDEMALLKMNVFHWHLVDDQGWRIEIKKYPKLTEVGAYRKSTQINEEGKRWKGFMQSGEPHSGFYTQEEIKEILKYAAERHITVVPEIEMPGHSTAAIAAYPWLGTSKEEVEVPTYFGKLYPTYDVTDPKVYQFLTDVLDEVMELFPSPVIHIGGDEVKFDHWRDSELVQAYMKENNIDTPADLQIHFTNRISQYIQSKGNRMMGWNDILGHKIHAYQDAEETSSSKQKLSKETVVHFWKGDVKLITEAAEKGYDIVNSLYKFTYLDLTYAKIPVSKSYSFNPIPEGLAEEHHKKIIGVGCQMWSEWVPTVGQMHYQIFPRIAALAEVAWTESDQKDFESFKVRLKPLQKHWQQRGIYCAPEEAVFKNK